jgi:RIO-like serine/threonine protein kinase
MTIQENRSILETGIGTLGKIKIIRALTEERRMVTIYVLHKRTGLKREDIKRNLKDLTRIEWVKEKKMANTMYYINRENEYVKELLAFFLNVGYVGEG